MRTLQFGLRVADRERSLAFYRAVGFGVVGSAPQTPLGHLTMLRLPGDEFVTVELVSGPADGQAGSGACSGLSHFAVHVESLSETVDRLRSSGIEVQGSAPPQEPVGVLTAWITDPDGNRIELVQWPPGHPEGLSAADWEA